MCQELKTQLPYLLAICCLMFRYFEFRFTVAKFLFVPVAWVSTRKVSISNVQSRFQDRQVPMDVRLGALKLYRRHLLDQYADRCGVWAMRDISGEEMGRCVIMVTDGADQVSFSI